MFQSDLFNASKQFSSLEDVLNAIKGMKNDPLANTGMNIVISRGNPNTKLLIIGEAPGPQENIQGKPFVGPAGQLLDKICVHYQFCIPYAARRRWQVFSKAQ